MSAQVTHISTAAIRRGQRAAQAHPFDACTPDVAAATPLPLPIGVAQPGDPAPLPSCVAAAGVQCVSYYGEAATTSLPFWSLQFRPAFVERAAVVLGCAGAALLLGIRLAGGA